MPYSIEYVLDGSLEQRTDTLSRDHSPLTPDLVLSPRRRTFRDREGLLDSVFLLSEVSGSTKVSAVAQAQRELHIDGKSVLSYLGLAQHHASVYRDVARYFQDSGVPFAISISDIGRLYVIGYNPLLNKEYSSDPSLHQFQSFIEGGE